MPLGSLKFVYHIDGSGASLVDSMDLLNFAQGFELAEGGWTQQVPAGDNVTLIETLTFRVSSLSQDALAARLQVLDEWITRVDYYRSYAMRTAVWLRVQVTDESQPRQALITRMQYAVSDSSFGTMWADSKFISTLTIVLERSAFWEEITPQSDTLGAVDNYTLDTFATATSGDVPARIWTALTTPTASNRQNTLYLGIKDDRYFNPALFQPRRPLNAYEAGVGTDASFADLNTTMGGRRMRITFATTTLVQRHILPVKYLAFFDGVNITLSTLTNDYVRGRYLCLMRATAVTEVASPVIRARIRVGYTSSTTGDKVYPRVTITNNEWNIYEMGVITMPQDRSSSHNTSLDMAIKLDAELISADGEMYVDGYILIPLDGAIRYYSDDGIISGVGALARDALVETNPVIESYGYTIDGLNAVYDSASIQPFDWSLPLANDSPCVLVVAAASDADESLVSTDWDSTISYFRRWRTLRGNE